MIYNTQIHWVRGFHASSGILNNYKAQHFLKLGLFPSSSEGRKTTTLLRLGLSMGPNKVGVSLPSLEDGNKSSVRSFTLSSYLELWTMDKVHKLGDSKK
jgi:hypothetical protein